MKFDFIDAHTHVNFSAYDADRAEVVKRAAEAGVVMINVGTQLDTSRAAVEMAEKNDGVFAIVGLHPIHTTKSHHDVAELGEEGKAFTSRGETLDDATLAEYKKMLAHPKVVGVGECGLDYYRLDPSSVAKQREDFSRQIALANEAGKPLMLHIRPATEAGAPNAYRDAHEILKALTKVRGDVHFFAGSYEEAKLFLDLGFTISFTGVITFARSYDEVVKNVPLDSILSETDAPYVTPAPFRGKRNEPIYVREVVKKIAELRGEDFEKVRAQLLANAQKMFSLSA